MKVENTTTYWNAQFEKEYKEFMKMVQRKKIMDIEKIRWAHERFYYMAYYIPMKSKVLEIACGLGHFCRFLRARNVWMDITGIDFSTTAIRYAQRLDADNKYLVVRYQHILGMLHYKCCIFHSIPETSLEAIEMSNYPLWRVAFPVRLKSSLQVVPLLLLFAALAN